MDQKKEDSTEKKTRRGNQEYWSTFKKNFASNHPDLKGADLLRAARKAYIPSSGKPKTLTRIHLENWRSRNKGYKKMNAIERKEAIRKDFIDRL